MYRELLKFKSSETASRVWPLLLYGGALLCLFNFVLQLWEVGFTTADDTATSALNPGHIWATIVTEWDRQLQRPTFYLSALLNYCRLSLPQTQVIFRSFVIIPNLIAIGLFSLFVGRVFQNRTYAIAAFLFTIATAQHTWYHHSFTAFPLNLHLGYILCLISFIFFDVGLKRQSWRILACVGILQAIPILIYEMFSAYLLMYPLLLLFNRTSLDRKFLPKLIAAGVLFLVPIGIVLSLFARYYLANRFSTTYPGTSVSSDFSVFSYLKAIWVFSSSALPGTVFRHYDGLIKIFFDINGRYFEFTSLNKKMRLIWIAVPLVFSGFMLKLWVSSKAKNLDTVRIVTFALMASVLIFASNLLVALTDGHQRRALSREIIYSGTHFSLFGWVFALCFLIYVLKSFDSRKTKVIFTLLVASLLAPVYRTQISNTVIANIQALEYSPWKLLERFNDDGYFEKRVTPKTIIIGRGIYGEQSPYWGLFHPQGELWVGDIYWYRFSSSAFGRGLPIFSERSHCDSVLKDCALRTDVLKMIFIVDYQKRSSVLKICNDQEFDCTEKRFKAYF